MTMTLNETAAKQVLKCACELAEIAERLLTEDGGNDDIIETIDDGRRKLDLAFAIVGVPTP